jgi:hypothetical protein
MKQEGMDILGQGLVYDNFKFLQIRQDILEGKDMKFAQTHGKNVHFCRTDDDIYPKQLFV